MARKRWASQVHCCDRGLAICVGFRLLVPSLSSIVGIDGSVLVDGGFDASRARKLCGLDGALVERWWGSVLLRRLPQSLGRLVMYARHSDYIEFVDST